MTKPASLIAAVAYGGGVVDAASPDVAKPFGDAKNALSRIDMPVRAIPSSSDRLVTPVLTQDAVSNRARVAVATLPTKYLFIADPATQVDGR